MIWEVEILEVIKNFLKYLWFIFLIKMYVNENMIFDL